MNDEIELKFIANRDIWKPLVDLMRQWTIIERDSVPLLSVYFDTPDWQLLSWDMGLRLRSERGQQWQTLKTPGQTLGGVHQRPEFNHPFQGELPQLALFTGVPWPEPAKLVSMQHQLREVFRTDFVRLRMVVEVDRLGVVEVAADRGHVSLGGNVSLGEQWEVINEIELELLDGSPKAMFVLAKQVAQLAGVQLACINKAQRGYHLALHKPFTAKSLPGFELTKPDAAAIRRYLEQLLNHALYHLQLSQPEITANDKPQALLLAINSFSLLLDSCEVLAKHAGWFKGKASGLEGWQNSIDKLRQLDAEAVFEQRELCQLSLEICRPLYLQKGEEPAAVTDSSELIAQLSAVRAS
ncbi:inorganic triphosphatase [Aliagarivorans taiwanensis]|uniref:CYTH domain-containing protein n=1 Tax=Aliagarivorans taiwanensis TaxID=561966 RepID=UPI0004062F8A|nr:CYTH domain-containing protein [Aliagarivorans taiwanensis]